MKDFDKEKFKDAQELIFDAKNTYKDNVLELLKSDPFGTDHEIHYKELEEYLEELQQKDGSIIGGIISALEMYLEK